jgi:hypothetical protein
MRDIRPSQRPAPPPEVSSPRRPALPYPSDSPSSFFSRRRKSRRLRRWVTGGVFSLVLLVAGGVAMNWTQSFLFAAGERGVRALEAATIALRSGDFAVAQERIAEAEAAFQSGNRILHPLTPLFRILRPLPGLSPLASGAALFAAGEEFSRGGGALVHLAGEFLAGDYEQSTEERSLIGVLRAAEGDIATARTALGRGQRALSLVRSSDIPADKRETFEQVSRILPSLVSFLEMYDRHQTVFEELLGAHGPRNYLFLFQNNQELRATGGFIGSYARLEMVHGHVRQFFVDGIFNPDGQLKENIVPPKPIQKISAGWSLHDSNWFPDFPHSAEKAIFFYEKTGGPTVDGVIALTPAVIERLLAVAGPIALPEYGVIIDTENFIPIIQEEVEVGYDKEENNPKRILGDLTSLLLDRLLEFRSREDLFALARSLGTSLNERHILIYSRHPAIEEIIRTAGWSGAILPAPHDYLSVVHSNINGYKTDGVIDESIVHETEIGRDGSIVDTVTITRRHNGGKTPYEWWNKVNADYLRVYVPLGAELLSAEGITREFPPAPLDYATLGFRIDPDVAREETGTRIDEASGTRISTDAGKTVFGNWVYVSPGEAVTVVYRYRLPFRLSSTGPVGHSLLVQKQSGSRGSDFRVVLTPPDGLVPVWQTPENLIPYERTFDAQTKLSTDFFWGFVFDRTTP